MKKSCSVFVALVLAFIVNGCATQTINNAKSFADAGVVFSGKVPPVMEESFKRTAEVDSLVLSSSRSEMQKTFSKKEIETQLTLQNNALKERATLLNDITRHSNVLKAYFVALQSLATSNAPGRVGEETRSLVTEAAGINKEINEFITENEIGNANLATIIPQAAEFTVRGIQAKALQSELEEHGENIEREIAFLEGMMKFLAEVGKAENETIQENKINVTINTPFISSGNLPSNWSENRANIFWNAAQAPAFAAAENAARLLRINFVAVMEGRSTAEGIQALIQSVTELAAVFEPAKES